MQQSSPSPSPIPSSAPGGASSRQQSSGQRQATSSTGTSSSTDATRSNTRSPSGGHQATDARQGQVTTNQQSVSVGPQVTNVAPLAESIDSWTNHAYSKIFHVTLDPKSAGLSAKEYIYLEEASQELEATELSSDIIDQVLWYAVRENGLRRPSFVSYLYGSWTRAVAMARALRKREPDFDEKVALLTQAKLAIQRFSVIVSIADPEEKQLYSDLGLGLLDLWGRDPWEYALAVLDTAAEEGELHDLLSSVFDSVCRKMRHELVRNIVDRTALYFDYKPYLTLLEQLVSDKRVAASIASLDRFKIKQNYTSPNVMYDTLLGPFFCISPIDSNEVVRMFPHPDTVTPIEVERVATDIRVETKVLQDRLFYICDQFVRSSPDARIELLRYLAGILKFNHKRLALMTNREELCSDGFMLNISVVLDKLSQPFIDPYGMKLDKIDPDYFASKSCILDVSEETKIVTDLAQSKSYYESNANDREANFVSHVFFITAAYMQYGINGCITSLDRSKRMIDNMKFQIDRLERAVAVPSPQQAVLGRNLEMAKKNLLLFQARRLALQGVLNYDVLADSLIAYCEFVLLFLIRVAEPSHKYPDNGHSSETLTLPFPEGESDIPARYANYPEFLVEGIISYLMYVSRNLPHVLVRQKRNTLVEFCVCFLSSTQYIKNPYVKGKLVEILFYGALEFGGHPGYFISIFDSNPLCLKYLLTGLMRFYIECEQTGASSQFYEKFTTRFYISEIIRCIWANDAYRAKLEKESQDDVKFFVRFVALLLNDVTYLLDESLTKLGDIHRLQKEISENPQSANEPLDPSSSENYNTNENEDDEPAQTRASSLADAERQAKSCMQLANKSVLLLKMFTSAVPKAFVLPEIVDRLAAMLNYNLAALVGPRCNELKVSNPEKYGFNPKLLLSDMSSVYVNLRFQDAFVKAVARDGRSFSPANIDRAAGILGRWGLQSKTTLDQLTAFKQAAEQAKLEDEEGELELGDVPDEFLDPLMFTLMEDPVTLPSSKVVMDLGTIKSHLLSDPKDPFNRAPLKIEDVVPNTELKDRIESWKREQREKFRQTKSEDVEMAD